MAEFCTNFVIFQQPGANEELMDVMERYSSNENGEGVFISEGDENPLFEIFIVNDPNQSNDEPLEFSFMTKWRPPFDELVKLGIKHNSDFYISYEELTQTIVGQARFDVVTKELHIKSVPEDRDSYMNFDDVNNIYTLQTTANLGESYESESDAFERALTLYGEESTLKY